MAFFGKLVVKILKNLKKVQKNHENDLQSSWSVLYYNSVAPEKESDEVDNGSALGHAIRNWFCKKIKKISKFGLQVRKSDAIL